MKGRHSPPFGDWAKPNFAYPPRRFVFPLSADWAKPILPILATGCVPPFGDLAKLNCAYPP